MPQSHHHTWWDASQTIFRLALGGLYWTEVSNYYIGLLYIHCIAYDTNIRPYDSRVDVEPLEADYPGYRNGQSRSPTRHKKTEIHGTLAQLQRYEDIGEIISNTNVLL